jgi:hypothetical protein
MIWDEGEEIFVGWGVEGVLGLIFMMWFIENQQ